MKILVINSPAYFLKYDRNRQFSYGRFGCSDPIPHELGGRYATAVKDHYVPYPWALGYASALLKRDSRHQIKALDCQAQDFSEEDFAELVEDFLPDVLVFDLPTITFEFCMELIKPLKKKFGFKLILVGLHASGLPRETMRDYPAVDYVIKNDYGLQLLKFAKYNFDPKKADRVPLLFYRQGKRILASKAEMKWIPFDDLPYPDREDLLMDQYHDLEVMGKPTIHLVTSRSCPFTCSYCNVRVFFPQGFYWKRSIKSVIEEMEFLKEKMGANQLYFDDDIMTHDQKWMINFSKEILKKGLKIPWSLMGDINLKEETIKMMVKAGACGMKFGVESINPKTLKNITKTWVSKEKVYNFVKMAKKHGLWLHGDFIVGIPGDNRESMEEMIKYAIDLDLNTAQIYSAQPLPGTPFYQQAVKNKWLVAKKWDEYDGNYLSPVSYPDFPKEEIEEMLRKFKTEWEMAAVKKFVQQPWRLLRYARGRGIPYTLKKIITVLKKGRKDHLYIAGT
ncbi:MAG: radical SAM protein [Candidatus Pacebacteria bacterium]|nr:radical SAM protein [Candidatus Paceibacterota bacterium]